MSWYWSAGQLFPQSLHSQDKCSWWVVDGGPGWQSCVMGTGGKATSGRSPLAHYLASWWPYWTLCPLAELEVITPQVQVMCHVGFITEFICIGRGLSLFRYYYCLLLIAIACGVGGVEPPAWWPGAAVSRKEAPEWRTGLLSSQVH